MALPKGHRFQAFSLWDFSRVWGACIVPMLPAQVTGPESARSLAISVGRQADLSKGMTSRKSVLCQEWGGSCSYSGLLERGSGSTLHSDCPEWLPLTDLPKTHPSPLPIPTAILGWASPTLHLDDRSSLLPGACVAPPSPVPLSSLPPVSSPAPPLSATPLPRSFVFQPHPPCSPAPSHMRTHSFTQVSPSQRPFLILLACKAIPSKNPGSLPADFHLEEPPMCSDNSPGLASTHLTLHNPHEPGKDLIWCTSRSPVQA